MWYNSYFLLGMDQCKSTKKLNKMRNNRLFIQTFMRLMETAMRRYRIEGLPDTMSERVILQSMIVYGSVVFFKHGNSVLALPGVPSGNGYNLNGDPVSAWVFSKNGMFNQEIKLYIDGGANDSILTQGANMIKVKSPDGIILWENKTRFPFLDTIIYYASAIADTYRTIDVSRTWIKQPFIPVCEESVMPSVKKMFQDIKDNDEMIVASTGIQSIDKFNIIPIDTAESSIDSAKELIDFYEAKFREACGMKSNMNSDKKGENLISDELHQNDEYVEAHTNDMIDYIQSQLEVANKFLGTSMRVVEVEVQEEVQEDENSGSKAERGVQASNNSGRND